MNELEWLQQQINIEKEKQEKIQQQFDSMNKFPNQLNLDTTCKIVEYARNHIHRQIIRSKNVLNQ
jgi:hypothetical protein